MDKVPEVAEAVEETGADELDDAEVDEERPVLEDDDVPVEELLTLAVIGLVSLDEGGKDDATDDP